MKGNTLLENYEKCYEKVSVIPQQTDEKETEFFADLVKLKNKNILDMGCAEGRLAILLASRGHKVTAADISDGYLLQVKKFAKENGISVSTIKCDIEEDISQFNRRKFDVIFFMDIIEHLKCPALALGKLQKLLRKDGILYIHTPNVFSISNIIYYLIGRKKPRDYNEPENVGALHLQIYDYETIERMMNFVGFKIQEVIPTKYTLPPKLQKFAFLFKPLLKRRLLISDNLLLKCTKSKPINIEKTIEYWTKRKRGDKERGHIKCE